MRIALLIAGYLRNYEENINFIKNEIIFKYKNVDIYLHITKNENTEDKYLNNINETDINYIINTLSPLSIIIEDNILYDNNKNTNNTLNHWNKLFKLNELKKIHENSLNFKYDMVIRLRPDLYIKTKNIFDINVENNIYIPSDSKIDKNRSLNINNKYICDALAYGNSESMDNYFNINKVITNLISEYGYISETLLYNYLNNYNINYKLIDIDYSFILSKCNVFAICGDSGSGKSTLSNLLKNIYTDSFKLECDRYHKWERTNKNWENVTHLNPNANYITKMYEDIFNLKLGNDIYQVDYDHYSGKFTEKQLINSSNNLIVCGLHSLYNNNNSLYDLKIYIDTDEKLKNKWKIMRDVKERGYTMERVLESIKKRESDFKEYIEPQKNNADIIINFYPLTPIDYNKLDEETLVGLNLVIDKRFDIKNITNELNVNFKLTENKNSYIINFTKYEDNNFLNKFNIQLNNNYYDYILFFILNLKNT
jgi:uridine kinase